jgi:hypothetical protein
MTTRITSENITDATIGTADLASSVPLNTQWQAVKTGDFTAVAGEGYFVDTTSAAVEVTLPASPSAGDVVVLKDYARNWGTNNVTIASALLDGATTTTTFSTTGQAVTLVYMDGTKGWSLINDDASTNLLPATFTSATGGTITTSGDFKIHTFTGDGCFVVSTAGNSPINPSGGPGVVDYLVVAGGGGSAGGGAPIGGGGGGGFRESKSGSSGCWTASPLATPTGITVSATTYPVTVGGGGPASPTSPASNAKGSNSIFSTITSAGGGGGASSDPTGDPGGSGSGAGGNPGNGKPGGSGNTPPVSPPQGNNGGDGFGSGSSQRGGGGGGATAGGSPGNCTGNGGNGATTSISGSPETYSGGGGAGSETYSAGSGGTGGGGNGGQWPSCSGAENGSANTGGGAGSGYNTVKSGGKGIVILRYKFQ